jgi:hypothetical protein
MAKCIKCGADTQLFDRGVPICLACSDAMEAKRNPSPDGKVFPGLPRRKEKEKQESL